MDFMNGLVTVEGLFAGLTIWFLVAMRIIGALGLRKNCDS
jgi:hypothetical protein